METIKNLLSGGSQSTDEQRDTHETRHVSGKLSGEGSHFPEGHSTHMPGSFDADPLYEAKVGTGITSAVPSTSTTASTHTGVTGHTVESTTAAQGRGITSSFPEAEAAAAAAYHPSHPSHPSHHTQSSHPTSTTTTGHTGNVLADKPSASGEYAGASAAGVQGQSIPHAAQTTSLARDTSSALPQTSSSQTASYQASQAPVVSGLSSTQQSALGASSGQTSSSQPTASGEYRGDEAAGVSGQSVPHAAKTTSAGPSAAAAAVYSANDKTTSHNTAPTSVLPDRSVTSGTSGTSGTPGTSGTGVAIGGTFTERSYALAGGDAHGPHTTATANRLDPHVDNSSSTTATAFSHGNTARAHAPSATKVSQPVPSDPISTAPLTSSQESSHHYGRDAALVGTAAGVGAAGIGAATSADRQHSTGHDSTFGAAGNTGQSAHSGRPGTTTGEHNPHGNDSHAVNRNFKDRVGGGDVVEEAHAPTESKHHLGRDTAAGTGAVGAAGLASYGIHEHQQHQSTGASLGQASTGTSQPQTSSTGFSQPQSSSTGLNKSSTSVSQPSSGLNQSSAGVNQPLTTTTSKNYGSSPLIIGGTPAAGTHSGYISQENQPTTTTLASAAPGTQYKQAPSGVASSDAAYPSSGLSSTAGTTSQGSQHHYGRDAAIAGGAVGATGLAAHELQQKSTTQTPSSQQYGTPYNPAHEQQQKSTMQTPSSQQYGTQYNHLGDGTPSGISPKDPAYSSEGITSTNPATSHATEHHYARDAALAGGVAGGAGVAAHQLGQSKPTNTAASESYGTHYSHLPDGTPSGISHKDAAHPASGGIMSTSTPATTHATQSQATQSHAGRDAVLGGGAASGLAGATASEASARNTTATSGMGSSATTGTGHIPKGYPFDSEKIERVADEAHGREHHPAEGQEKKHGFLDKLLHRDHPNKLHKEPDHAEGPKTTHEAYDQGHSSTH